MENQDHASSSLSNSLAIFKGGHEIDVNQDDGDEELLFLQVAEANSEPASPNLIAVMNENKESNSPEGQEHPASLLLERPQTSEIDMTGFCFARPTHHGKPLLLQSSAKGSSATPMFHKTIAQNQRGAAMVSDSTEDIVQAKCVPCPPDHRYKTPQPNKPNEGLQNVARSRSPSAAQTKELKVSNACAKLIDRESSTKVIVNQPQRQGPTNVHAPPVNDVQHMPQEFGDPAHDQAVASQNNTDDQTSDSLRQGKDRPKRTHPIENIDGTMTENGLPAVHSSAPASSEFRVAKRRRVNGKKLGWAKKHTLAPDDKISSQLSEEDLFQLLINRVRIREENEAAASNLQEQMEADILELREENKTLKNQLDIYNGQLQKRTSECRSYKSHAENWRARLGKFKGILNEIGAEYQNLHSEAIQLKATRTSLEEEKNQIKDSIQDAQRQISQVVNVVGERRSHLSAAEGVIDSLKQALRNSEEKANYAQTQLSDEKKRSAILESYIQNYSQAQAKHLGLIRADQLSMIDRLDSAFGLMDKKLESSQTSIQSTLGSTLDECLLVVRHMSENLSTDKTDVQHCKEIVLELASSMDSLKLKLAKEIEKSTEIKENMTHNIKEHLELVQNCAGTQSALVKQLCINEERCNSLREKLEVFEPSLYNAQFSIEGLGRRECDLAQQIDLLEKTISTTQILNKAEISEKEVRDHSAEKIALERQIEQLTMELKSVEERLKCKEIENEGIEHSLLEATSKIQETEKQARQIESEASHLKDKVKTIEIEVREELNRASVISRDQSRAKFEQELHKVLREKTEVEKDMEKVQEMLTEAQLSLAEKESSTEKQCNKLNDLLLEREQRIQSFEKTHTSEAAIMAEKDAEIKRLQESTASDAMHKRSLQQQLSEAKEKIANLNSELSQKINAKNCEAQCLQNKLHILHRDFSKKKEECELIQKELCDANSAKSSLESGKEKAKAEIHALLKRVQESECWMKNAKETLDRLGLLAPEEPFAVTWKRLETYLQSTNVRNSSDLPLNDTLPDYNRNSLKEAPMTLTPIKSCANPTQSFVQTTEVIYRTQSVQKSTRSSPAPDCTSSPGIIGYYPKQQSSTHIKPFSIIGQQLSPVPCSPCSPLSQEPSDLEDMLNLTPPNNAETSQTVCAVMSNPLVEIISLSPSNKEGDTSTNTGNGGSPAPKSQSVPTESITKQQADIIENTKEFDVKHKEVKFETENPSTGSEKCKFAEPLSSNKDGHTFEAPLIETRVRTNRRTYSRFRQSSTTKGYERLPLPNAAASVGVTANSDIHAESSYTSNDKRSRMSAAPSYPRARNQTQGSSEHFERKGSPTSLASGSSRHSSTNGANANNQKWTKGPRRGRKARGDRYNARFIQGI